MQELQQACDSLLRGKSEDAEGIEYMTTLLISITMM